ncbi:MAG TPA: TlpA disulfide reductase family protein [Planctomycetota bacterium]|nr:TlpA disulfide reductase family protein [Planctomycetota bacterium]
MPIHPRQMLLAPLLAALSIAAAGGPARASGAEAYLDIAPGRLAAFTGTTRISRESAPGVETNMELDLAFAFVAFPGGGAGGARRVLLVRSISPRGPGPFPLPLPASGDAAFFRVGKAFALEPEEDPHPASVPVVQMIDAYLPAAFFPAFDLPPSGEAVREESVRFPGRGDARLRLRVKVATTGSTVTVTRTLDEVKADALEIDGARETVEAFKEVFCLDAGTKRLLGVVREVETSSERGGLKQRLAVASTLEARESRLLEGADLESIRGLESEVGAVFEAFRLQAPTREIYARVRRANEHPGAKLISSLPGALLSRFSTHRQALERAEAEKRRSTDTEKAAPDFTLEDLDGKKVSFLEAARGKVVLLTFWGFRCVHCRKEAPYLSKLQAKYGDKGFTVIAVNGYDEPRGIVEAFVKREKLLQPILLMGGTVARRLYGVTGFPTSFWIDAKGRIVEKEVGFLPERFPRMEARLESLLGEARADPLEELAR